MHNAWHLLVYHIATMPLGSLDHDGRPFSLATITQAGQEDLIFRFMSALEPNFKPRAVPKKLDSKSDIYASLWSIARTLLERAIDTLCNWPIWASITGWIDEDITICLRFAIVVATKTSWLMLLDQTSFNLCLLLLLTSEVDNEMV